MSQKYRGKVQGYFCFLGTGGSMGVPVIGCSCPVCQSSSTKDKRLRTSGLITLGNKTILVDCGPDFRQQALTHNIRHLDGVIITHAHHDHTAGVDELRVFYMHTKQALPCMMSKETAADIMHRFHYLFDANLTKGRLVSKVDMLILPEDRGTVNFLGIDIQYMSYLQAGMKVNGFRIGNFAYLTDIHEYPETIFDDLAGVEVLVLSALRFTPSHLHLTFDQAIDFSKRVHAKETWLTHICHEISHEKIDAYLPANVRVAYDGLTITFSI